MSGLWLSKTDWCLISQDGTACICARISEGGKQVGSKGAGWLHILKKDSTPNKKAFVNKPAKAEPAKDFTQEAMGYHRALSNPAALAVRLGVSSGSLIALKTGWCAEKQAYTFPMSDGFGNIIGIRTRTLSGKFAIPGSKNALFLPAHLKHNSRETLFVCEGPTDCAALLDLGFEAIGRASCNTGAGYLKQFLGNEPRRQVVIFADHDEGKKRPGCDMSYFPGQEGAMALSKELKSHTRGIKLIRPPFHKDVRQWYQAGAKRETILMLVRNSKFI